MKLVLPFACWLLAAQVPIQGPPAPAVLTSAVLLGQVIDAETGQPVDDASVTLTGRPVPARGRAAGPAAGASFLDLIMRAQGGDGSERAAAGANGRFVFRGLPVATYTVRAEAPGYLSRSIGLGRPGGTESFEIREGQTSARVTVRLWKQAVLTGAVVDEAGEPVIGARVQAYRREISRFGAPSFESTRAATTDDRGLYRLSGLVPGEYLVVVPQSQTTAPAAAADAFMQGLFSGQMPEGGLGAFGRGGGASPMDPRGIRVGEWRLTSDNVLSPASADGSLQAYRTVFYPSATSPADAAWVAIRSGEERGGVDFAIRPVVTGRVTGLVTGPKGPVAALPIRLVPAGDRLAGEPSSLDVADGQTVADGRFTLLAVPPGQYRIIAEREGPPDMSNMPEEFRSNPMIQMAMNMRGAGQTTLFGETTVTVGPGEAADVAIAVTEGMKVTGRLEFEGGPAPAKDVLTRATVTLRPLDRAPGGSSRVRPDAEGKFAASGVLPGRYAVSTSLPREGTAWLVKQVALGGRDVTDSAVAVEDKDVADLVVTLSNRVGQLRGTVRRETGAGLGAVAGPPPALTAVVVPANYMSWTDPQLIAERVHFVTVATDGSFLVGPMRPGEYLVAVVDEAQLDPGGGVAQLRRLAAQATRITVIAGDGNAVTLSVTTVRR